MVHSARRPDKPGVPSTVLTSIAHGRTAPNRRSEKLNVLADGGPPGRAPLSGYGVMQLSLQYPRSTQAAKVYRVVLAR